MDKKLFAETIRKEVERRLPEKLIGSTVIVMPVEKNNITLTGLHIMEPNTDTSPTIYLEEFIEEVERGKMTVQDTADKVIDKHLQFRNVNFDAVIQKIKNFDKIKRNIEMKVIGIKGNEKYLENCVYDTYLDMAVVYIIRLQGLEQEVGSIKINKSLMEMWGVTEENIRKVAYENTKDDYELQDMAEMSTLSYNLSKELSGFPKGLMYVLSNSKRFFGAHVITNQEIMKKVYEELEESFYIIPSNIHQVIIVPWEEDCNPVFLKYMVAEVNTKVVLPEEVLTNSIYYFDGEKVSII